MPAKSVDVDAILRQFQSGTGPKCAFAQLEPKARELVEALMADDRVQSSTITRAVKHHYPTVRLPVDTVRRHRRDLCSCRK